MGIIERSASQWRSDRAPFHTPGPQCSCWRRSPHPQCRPSLPHVRLRHGWRRWRGWIWARRMRAARTSPTRCGTMACACGPSAPMTTPVTSPGWPAQSRPPPRPDWRRSPGGRRRLRRAPQPEREPPPFCLRNTRAAAEQPACRCWRRRAHFRPRPDQPVATALTKRRSERNLSDRRNVRRSGAGFAKPLTAFGGRSRR